MKQKTHSVPFLLIILASMILVALLLFSQGFSFPPAPGGQLYQRPLPDLTVSAINNNPSLVVTVSNSGRGSAPSTVAGTYTPVGGVAGYFPHYQIVPPLPPGGSFTYGVTVPSSPGPFVICADILTQGSLFPLCPPGGAVNEENENNNMITI